MTNQFSRAGVHRSQRGTTRRAVAMTSALIFLVGFSTAFAQRTTLRPGINFFSPQQDIELGKKVAQDAEKKLNMLDDKRVDAYLQQLGQRLAAQAQDGDKYPFSFKAVNDPNINAFALPGGFLFINRGTIEAADNEAELAGVIGHEIGHVVLRHGTNQATKAELAQAPLAVLGGIFGSNSAGALLAKLGANFAVGSVLLKYSRNAERQADLVGAHILYDCNYNPRDLSQFFEKLDTKGSGSDFFSDHPNPENRIQVIDAEIDRMGRHLGAYTSDSKEFEEIKRYVKSLPPPPKGPASGTTEKPAAGGAEVRKPAQPSTHYLTYDGGGLSLRYPDNWKAYGKDDALTLAPEEGIIRNGQDSAVAYGVIKAVFPDPRPGGSSALEDATSELISRLRGSNPGMKVSSKAETSRVGGKRALSTLLANDSPLGGQETDWLVTVMRPEGLVYFVFVAPEADFAGYRTAFREILNSVRFGGN